MSIEHINPAELLPPDGFSQIVKVTGQSKVHIAGQSAFDKDMNLIGGSDYHAQTLQVLKNLKLALTAAGSSPEQMISCVIYVVNMTPEAAAAVASAFNIGQDGKPFPAAASALIGVQNLMLPEMLIEMTAVAAAD
jgi:enamine deaminase RidA (YjgF/YER057c/UK114 family)